MSKTALSRRLARLEADHQPSGRVVPIWGWGRPKDEVEAEKAEMIRTGRASERDTFVVFSWVDGEEPGSVEDTIIRTVTP